MALSKDVCFKIVELFTNTGVAVEPTAQVFLQPVHIYTEENLQFSKICANINDLYASLSSDRIHIFSCVTIWKMVNRCFTSLE